MKDRKREREDMVEEGLELYRWNSYVIHQNRPGHSRFTETDSDGRNRRRVTNDNRGFVNDFDLYTRELLYCLFVEEELFVGIITS